MDKEDADKEDVMTIAERRGFFFPSSEIYGSMAGFWEYGPLGVTLKNNFVELWRKELLKKDNMLEIDGSQIMPKDVFVASGHLVSFVDPLVKCQKCKAIMRADKLIEEKTGKATPEKLETKRYDELITKSKIVCPKCKGKLGNVALWNMMFKVGIGPEGNEAYLRPETCQSIFADFARLFKTMRCKLPLGIAQYGKSFRNEISPRQCLLRLREFYQTEIEVFFNPLKEKFEKFDSVKNYKLRLLSLNNKKEIEVSCKDAVGKIISSELIAYYLALLQQFYAKTGINMSKTRFRQLGEDEKAFYAKEAWDFEVLTDAGWVELVACNYRGDYDLGGHAKQSKQNLAVLDEGKNIIPHIFELSMGVDRSIYCILEHAFAREKEKESGKEKAGEERNILKLPSWLAPIQIAVFPLVSKDKLPEKAKGVYNLLKEDFAVFYDETGSIGRRYRRQDEIGTPICVTIDYQTLKDNSVTTRDRDTMQQKRVKIDKLKEIFKNA